MTEGFLFKDGDIINKEEVERRLLLADLRFKEAQAAKMENDVVKSSVSKDATLFKLEVAKGRFIDATKHKTELLSLTNVFISSIDRLVDRVVAVVNNSIDGGLSNIANENMRRDLVDLMNKVKLELAGERA
jgi:hypothetical protein